MIGSGSERKHFARFAPHPWLYSLLGSAVFALAALLRVALVPTEIWRWRDDAVITLSHALGWVQNGSPSVSASGDLVEGYTAPLQFLVSSVFFRLGVDSFALVLNVQVALGVAATGFFMTLLALRLLPRITWVGVIVVNVVIVAIGLLSWSSLGWLLSGMENSYFVPLLAASMAGLAWLPSAARVRWGVLVGVALGLAGISRTEFAVILIPAFLLLAFWFVTRRVRRLNAVVAVGVAIVIVVALHAWRWLTFGTLVPNSALVQGKTQLNWSSLAVSLACAGSLILIGWLVSRDRGFRLAGLVLAAAWAVIVVALAIGSWELPIVDAAFRPFLVASLALGVVIALLAGLGIGGSRAWWAVAAIAPMPLIQGLAFGQARLDPNRITGASLTLLSIGAAVLVAWIVSNGRWASESDPRPFASVSMLVIAAAGIGAGAIVGLVIALWPSAPASSLCCSVDTYTKLLSVAEQDATDRGLPRVILANPDLGKVSFEKRVVMADLGLLGEPALANLGRMSPELAGLYVQDVIKPDVIEAHGGFSCYYAAWLFSGAFTADYTPVLDDGGGAPVHSSCPGKGNYVIYERKPESPGYAEEIALTQQLSANPANASGAVKAALAACTVNAGRSPDVWACEWIRRAVQRNAPELKSAGVYDKVVQNFATFSPLGEFDALLLTTPKGWGVKAADMFIKQVNRQ